MGFRKWADNMSQVKSHEEFSTKNAVAVFGTILGFMASVGAPIHLELIKRLLNERGIYLRRGFISRGGCICSS